MKKWYEDNPSQGVNTLIKLFGISADKAEWLALASQYRNHTNKATKKNHVHVHRESGSKALKKYNRYAWENKNV